MDEEQKLKEELSAIVSALRARGCDTVQIFVSRFDDDTGITHMIPDGAGVLGQRMHQVALWLAMCEKDTVAQINGENDEGEQEEIDDF